MGKVSIKSIAQKAGIATGTFYLYFADKETLIDTVVQEIYQELLEHIKMKGRSTQTVLTSYRQLWKSVSNYL